LAFGRAIFKKMKSPTHCLHMLLPPNKNWTKTSETLNIMFYLSVPPMSINVLLLTDKCLICSLVFSHCFIIGLRSSDISLLCQPFTETDFTRRGFSYPAPAVWNSLPRTVLKSPSITVFKSRLKTQLSDLAHIKQ